MGKTFKQRLETYSDSKKSNLILAADFKNIESSDYFGEYKKIVKTINDLGEYIAGLKINFHLLLPLDKSKISDICKLCKQNDIITIADMKLNFDGLNNIFNSGSKYLVVGLHQPKHYLTYTTIIPTSHQTERPSLASTSASAEARLQKKSGR